MRFIRRNTKIIILIPFQTKLNHIFLFNNMVESDALKEILEANRSVLIGPGRWIVLLMINGDTMDYSIVPENSEYIRLLPKLKEDVSNYVVGVTIPVMIFDGGVLQAHMIVPL